MPTLSDRARDQLIPEPIVFIEDRLGVVRFATDQLPWRAYIDTRAGIIMGPIMQVDGDKGRVVIIDGDGRTAVYLRTGITLAGAWICDLVRE